MTRCTVRIAMVMVVVVTFLGMGKFSQAQPSPKIEPPEAERGDQKDAERKEPAKRKDPPGLKRLVEKEGLWIDEKQKLVVVDGRVVLRRGTLELLACPKGTKDYESIIALDSKAMFVHTALLAIGAKPGSPVHFDPDTGKVTPAHGPIIDIWVLWKDKGGMNRKVRAQDWIRHIRTRKSMKHEWVFGGSHLVKHPDTGKPLYEADATGELICVSNFPTATMDLPIRSSADAGDLLFEPFTERIPPKGTHVRLVLRPRSKPMGDEKKNDQRDSPKKD